MREWSTRGWSNTKDSEFLLLYLTDKSVVFTAWHKKTMSELYIRLNESVLIQIFTMWQMGSGLISVTIGKDQKAKSQRYAYIDVHHKSEPDCVWNLLSVNISDNLFYNARFLYWICSLQKKHSGHCRCLWSLGALPWAVNCCKRGWGLVETLTMANELLFVELCEGPFLWVWWEGHAEWYDQQRERRKVLHCRFICNQLLL